VKVLRAAFQAACRICTNRSGTATIPVAMTPFNANRVPSTRTKRKTGRTTFSSESNGFHPHRRRRKLRSRQSCNDEREPHPGQAGGIVRREAGTKDGIKPIGLDKVRQSPRFSRAVPMARATSWASVAEPSGEKWTLAGNWISASRGLAKAYRSLIATPCSSMIPAAIWL
jgi:hypothetical protein